MKHAQILTRTLGSIAALIVAMILLSALFFTYKTFERSVQSDIFRYRQKLEDSVRRTAGAEYRRYFLLKDIAKTLADAESGKMLTNSLKQDIELLKPDGDLPYLVTSIGYVEPEKFGPAYEFDFSTGQWTKEEQFLEGVPLRTERDFFLFTRDAPYRGLYLLINNGKTARKIFFRLDRTGFIQTYVKEIIESMNPDFRFEWFDLLSPNQGAELRNENKNDPDGYVFRPFTSLFRKKQPVIPLIVEIPGIPDARKLLDTGSQNPDTSDKEKPDRPPVFHSGFYVKMYSKNGAYYHDIETHAAVAFLETTLIYSLVAGLIFLLLFQLQKTRNLRHKEKEFVAAITHELRTPLTVIRSAAENMTGNVIPTEKLPVYGKLITEQSIRLGNMIEKILAYSNIEYKKRKPESPVFVNLRDLIKGLKPGLATWADSRNLALKWETEGLPETGSGYPEVMSAAVANMVANAVFHAYNGKQGEIRIRFKFLIPDTLQITVEDDGRGIHPKEQKKIFNPFYRDEVSRNRQEKGSGLGLFITNSKAVMAGGRLSVESPYRRIDGRKPEGSRFTLIIPFTLVGGEKTDGK